jgi:hypothetical protein
MRIWIRAVGRKSKTWDQIPHEDYCGTGRIKSGAAGPGLGIVPN